MSNTVRGSTEVLTHINQSGALLCNLIRAAAINEGNLMICHILIPTDGSKLSERAVEQGMKFAKALGAKVTGLHVIPRFHAFTYRTQVLLSYHMALPVDSEAAYKQTTRACAKKFQQFIKRAAAKEDVACDTLHVRDDQPFRAIIAAAKKKGCDLILMASHGHSGIGGLLLGNETQKVLTHSHIPVLVYR
jgi:nucleotide-binding universal stress UspA family protein